MVNKCFIFAGIIIVIFLCPLLNFCHTAFYIKPEEETTEGMKRMQRDSKMKGTMSFILYGTLFPIVIAYVAFRADVYIHTLYDIPGFICACISVILTLIAFAIRILSHKFDVPSYGKWIMRVSYLFPIFAGIILLAIYNYTGCVRIE